jgi:diguanylate cyclase (GGDEF)-like protein
MFRFRERRRSSGPLSLPSEARWQSMTPDELRTFYNEQLMGNMGAIRGVMFLGPIFFFSRGVLDHLQHIVPSDIMVLELSFRLPMAIAMLFMSFLMRPKLPVWFIKTLIVTHIATLSTGICMVTWMALDIRAAYSLPALTVIFLAIPALVVHLRLILTTLGGMMVPILALCLVMHKAEVLMYFFYMALGGALGFMIRTRWLNSALKVFQLRQQLLRRAMRDPLTHALNRSGWESSIEANFPDGLPRPSAVMFFDLDNFKMINDVHGHPAGDALIQRTASGIQDQLRQEDLLARFGGEEFVVLLPGCGMPAALQVAERIRSTLNQSPAMVRTTISVGVAEYRMGETLEELIERADKALLYAKSHGKDQVVQAE